MSKKEVIKEIKETIEIKTLSDQIGEVIEDNTTLEIKKPAKKLTKEEYKEKFRKVNLQYSGRLYIDEKYKNPDKVLRIDNDDAATRKLMAELGYTVVQRQVEVGSGSLSQGSNLGSEVHIEQGISFSQPGILYEIDKEAYEARKELEIEDNNNKLEQTIEDSQREDQQKKRK